MELLMIVGKLLFIILFLLGVIVNLFPCKRYWEEFIPRLHEAEERHPVITNIVFIVFFGWILIALIDAIF